ncbi:uncharacterized protein [Physcomitrium patens]|uniref:BHLH domain-containing protein n=1 Tax=Physcomitrium patens TaxID=3218 RepID=A0A2K1KK91_PHYPA|nr:transcription factor bHLH49-like [Physcomitrium patens]XP_024376878.1 transcription factor bHLH49-like [Physcomitrium patens]XP_024376879.1 transcription factor bHLH49-like [Physcomitrium patens]PNR54189.1 hypothetical protein PHYPA_007866 [Physcomitrium patens]|eukprot:XP_024376877.1 transcription factor bHLH49-like [Physcomitrella patens]
MDKLRAMGYPLGITMDPTKGDMVLQEASTQHSLQQLSHDPSFAERAAKYSTFGTSNYAQRPQTYGSYDTFRDTLENESKISRSSSLNQLGSLGTNSDTRQFVEEEMKPKGDQVDPKSEAMMEAIEGAQGARAAAVNESSDGVSQENSSGSQQTEPLSNRSGAPQRKRKGSAAADGKGKTSTSSFASDGKDSKSMEANEQTSLKRQRSGPVKAERSASENSGDSVGPSSLKASSKSVQNLPKQDYIHVRARRGQATDSHSLAERVRREKISERMKFLQDLVPGCSKVTGKAVMLDEIINYVQSLQRQIEFLSMKLAAVNPRLDYGFDVLGKDLLQLRSPETTLVGPDPLSGYVEMHHAQVHHPMRMSPGCGLDMRSVESVCDSYLRRSMSVPTMGSLVSGDDFGDPLSQVCGNGDLQSVVEMGFIQGRQSLGKGSLVNHGSSLCKSGKSKVEL